MLTSPVTAWVVVGLTLSLLELIVPGVYLIWFGLAGFVMSIIVYITPLVFTTQLIWFALISAVFACIGLYVYRYIFSKATVSEEYKNLNNSAEQLVGMKVTVAEDSEDNQTKVKVGDTFW